MDQLREQLGTSAIVLASEKGGKVSLMATVHKSLNDTLKANELLGQVAGVLGGRGGGRADMAQGGADSLDKIDAAFAAGRQWLNEQCSN